MRPSYCLDEEDVGQQTLFIVYLSLLDVVRKHNRVAFRQAWKRFKEAVSGSVKLVPQAKLRMVIERDYGAMQGMTFGDVPDFGWIMVQLQRAEAEINRV